MLQYGRYPGIQSNVKINQHKKSVVNPTPHTTNRTTGGVTTPSDRGHSPTLRVLAYQQWQAAGQRFDSGKQNWVGGGARYGCSQM